MSVLTEETLKVSKRNYWAVYSIDFRVLISMNITAHKLIWAAFLFYRRQFSGVICSLLLFLFDEKIDYVFFLSRAMVKSSEFNCYLIECRLKFVTHSPTLIRIILIVRNWIVFVGIVNFHSYHEIIARMNSHFAVYS